MTSLETISVGLTSEFARILRAAIIIAWLLTPSLLVAQTEATDPAAPNSAVEQLIAEQVAKNERLTKLRESHDGPAAQAKDARLQAERLEAERNRHQLRFKHVRDAGDWTDSIGMLLQRYSEELPDVDDHRNRIRERRSEVADIRRELLDLQVQSADLRDMPGMISKLLEDNDLDLDDEQRAVVEPQLEQAFKKRRELIAPLERDYQDLLDALVLQLGRSEEELVRQTIEFRDYINERILWIPSMPIVSSSDGPAAWHSLRQLVSPHAWKNVYEILLADARRQPMPYVGLFTVILLTGITRRKMRRRMQHLGQRLVEGEEPTILPMLESLGTTFVLAIPWSIILWILGGRCQRALDASSLTQALGSGLQAGALALLNIELLRQVSRKRGLAEAHFGVSEQYTRTWRRDLWVLRGLVFLSVTLIVLVRQFEGNTHQPALTRLLFIVAMIVLAIIGNRVLRPSYGVILPLAADEPRTWFTAILSSARPLGIGIPLALALVASLGYIYAAERVFLRLQMTVWLIIVLWLAGGVWRRWIALAQHRQSGEQREAAELQSRRLLASLGPLLFAVGCYTIWVDVLPALHVFDQWQIWSYSGTPTAATPAGATATATESLPKLPVESFTLADLLVALIVLVMTSIVARNLPGLLDLLWFRRMPIDSGARYALVSLSQYLIVLIGGVWLFRVLGVSWGNVQWLVAAVSVGLGFGLQEIFANFVSGLIVLFERPIRVGDIVTIGGVSGTVTRIRARATAITDWDRKELIVPNKEFITGQLINWTLSDSVLRVVIKVAISYGADTSKAVEVLLRVARENAYLLREPAPQAVFTSFGHDGMDFELRAYVSGPDKMGLALHSLHVQVDQALRAAGLPLPYGTTDIHVRTFPNDVPIITIRQEPPR
jgi:potassium efflux system protein